MTQDGKWVPPPPVVGTTCPSPVAAPTHRLPSLTLPSPPPPTALPPPSLLPYRGFTNFVRDDFVVWRREGRLMNDGVTAKLISNHGSLANRDAGEIFSHAARIYKEPNFQPADE